MQLVVNSLLTTYEDTGDNQDKVILCLHGWGDDHRTFAGLTKALQSSYRVISVDLPGFGSSQAPNAVWGLDDYATFLSDFLKKLHVQEVSVLIGHSNGGALAILALSRGKLSAHRLVLLGAAGIRDQEKIKKLGLKVIAKTGKAATFWLPANKKKALQKRLYGAAGSDMLVVPHLQETFRKTVAQDVQVDAKTITIPTLLIYGEHDRATPVQYGEIYHRLITGSKLEVVPGAEHFVHHDKPTEVQHLIEEFIA